MDGPNPWPTLVSQCHHVTMQHVFSNCQHDISLFLPGEAIAVTILSVDIRKLMSVCLSIAFVMCVSNGQTLKRYHQVSDALLSYVIILVFIQNTVAAFFRKYPDCGVTCKRRIKIVCIAISEGVTLKHRPSYCRLNTCNIWHIYGVSNIGCWHMHHPVS